MRKTIIILLTVLLISSTKSEAQTSYNLTDSAAVNFTTNFVTEEASIGCINNGTLMDTVEWRVINYFIPNNWDAQVVCDWRNCFLLSDTAWHSPQCAPNSQQQNISFYAKRNLGSGPGCAIAVVEYRVAGQSSSSITNLIITSYSSASLCFPLAAEDVISEEQINMFPNPVSDKLNIQIKNKYAVRAVVNTLTGTIIDEKKILNNSVSFHLEQIPNGLYIIDIKNAQEKSIQVKKFLKR
jgi:hypothetical protein